MSLPTHQPDADRNLLFGILALQMSFIGRDALVAAMNAWVLEKQKPLGRILLEQKQLTEGQFEALEAVIAQHLKMHREGPELSLQSMGDASTVARLLSSIADGDVQDSLAKFSSGTAARDTINYSPPPGEGVRYRRQQLHKGGGLGEVYFAEDTELHREVALKEIKQKLADDPASRGRFVLEAEITGGLEHPGIVPVYGMGVYPNGRPYYAMRFIRGDSLKDAIEQFHAAERPGRDLGERSLAQRQLLRRFVDVCNAVAYAHSRGVLHRDLKPANIMLGKFGETLVVDWGLAKAGVKGRGDGKQEAGAEKERTLRPSSGSSVEPTQAGAVLGTIAFMSPEQAAGRLRELTPASDIYSLGSTLYVLLTNRKPYVGEDQQELLAKVRRGEFTPPRQVKPETPPALDAICRKAMALAPADRYPTALDFAADVEHWLGDEPVAAYPEPWMVRAGRWTRRHRTALVAAAVFLVSAVVALSVSTGLVVGEQRKTEKQRELAVKNYEMSREQCFRIIKLIETTEPEMAAQPALHDRRRELLTTASEACREFRKQEPEDLELRRRTAQIFRFTANFQRLTNETAAADALYQESISLQEKLASEFQSEAADRLQLADTLKDYANLQLKQGRLQAATDNANRALVIVESLGKDDPERPAYRWAQATMLLTVATFEYKQGRHEKSDKTMARVLQAVELYRTLVDGDPAQRRPYGHLLLASALNLKAMLERDSGRLEVANKTHLEAFEHVEETLKRRSKMVSTPDVLHVRAHCQIEHAKTWAKTPKLLPSAEKQAGLAATQWAGLAQNYPMIPMYQESLAVAYQVRGQMREDLKRYEEAREDFNRAQEMLAKQAAKYPDLPVLRGELGKSYAGIGRIGRNLGEKDFEAWFEKARIELREAVTQAPEHAEMRRALEEVIEPR